MDININKQLTDLKGEIDATTKKIDAKEEEWKIASPEDKPVILKSIEDLKVKEKGLLASRDKLFNALAPAPAPGKNTPLAFDFSAPPVYGQTCVCLCVLMRLVNPS